MHPFIKSYRKAAEPGVGATFLFRVLITFDKWSGNRSIDFSFCEKILDYLMLQRQHHIAYLRVHSRASSWYFDLSVLYILAISGTRGSSGLASVISEQMDSNTEKTQNYKIYKYIIKTNSQFYCNFTLKNQLVYYFD